MCVFVYSPVYCVLRLNVPSLSSFRSLLPSLSSVSILRCWWLFSCVNRVVVFCLAFREGTWPCSFLFILTLFKLALPSPPWVFLPLSSLSCLSEVSVSRLSLWLPLWLFLSKVQNSGLWSHCLFGLWQIRVAACDRGGLGCFCILLRASASSHCHSLSPFLLLYV